MIRLLLLFFAFLQMPATCAQVLSTISSRWNNSFVEWDIMIAPEQEDANAEEAPEEEIYGELKLRRLGFQEDFSEWTFELGGQRGTIRQKWKNDPSQWELRTYAGEVVTMRASWSNDPTEWRITDNTISLTIESRWKNRLDEWLVEDKRRGRFYVYTLRENDPRDWAIEDTLNEEVSEPMKMALLFTAIFHSTPKE